MCVCVCMYLCDVGILLLPVFERLLQVLFPQSLNGSDLELILGQQLTKFLWKQIRLLSLISAS